MAYQTVSGRLARAPVRADQAQPTPAAPQPQSDALYNPAPPAGTHPLLWALTNALKRRGGANNSAPGYADPNYQTGGGALFSDPNSLIGGGYGESINPNGSDALYNSIYQQLTSQAGARKRATLTGLRMRGGDIPGSFGVASLLSGLQGDSDLSQALAGAREHSVESNLGRAFTAGQGQLDFLRSTRQQREQFQREKEMEQIREMFERWRVRNSKKQSIGVTGPGGVGVSYSY